MFLPAGRHWNVVLQLERARITKCRAICLRHAYVCLRILETRHLVSCDTYLNSRPVPGRSGLAILQTRGPLRHQKQEIRGINLISFFFPQRIPRQLQHHILTPPPITSERTKQSLDPQYTVSVAHELCSPLNLSREWDRRIPALRQPQHGISARSYRRPYRSLTIVDVGRCHNAILLGTYTVAGRPPQVRLTG